MHEGIIPIGTDNDTANDRHYYAPRYHKRILIDEIPTLPRGL